MKQNEAGSVEALHQQALECLASQVSSICDVPAISHTDLPEAKPEDVLYREWNTYRREAARLLAQGHQGRYVLIKGEAIIGIWDTREKAKEVALRRFPMQPCLIHQIRDHEPPVRISSLLRSCLS